MAPDANWIDMGIIACYLLAMVGVAVWSAKKVKNLGDYALAGKSLGYPVMIGTLIGATIGAASTFGKAGKAYEVGIIFFIVPLGYNTGLLLFGFFARRLREVGLWTIPDALQKRYGGKGLEIVMGFAMMMAVIALFGGQIIGMGQIFSSIGRSFGLTYTSCILVAGGILILYTMVGGLFAVAYTDMIQTIIMIVSIGFILPGVVLVEAGNQGNIMELIKPPTGGDILGGLTVLYILSIFVMEACFCMVDPGLWQRANAAKNEKIIRNSMFITAGVYVYWSAVCVLLGVLGAVLIPNLVEVHQTSDAVIPALTVNYLPPILVGLVLAGLMAVMMSTASVALLISGTTVANDLVKPLKPELSDRSLLLVARLTVLIVGSLGVVFALVMEGIFEIILLAFAIYVSGVFVPVIAALYWGKATKAGAVVSSAAATVVVTVLSALDYFKGIKLYGIEPIFISLLVSLVLMVSVSIATYNPEKATPRIFPKRRKAPD